MTSTCKSGEMARTLLAVLRLYVYDDYMKILLFLAGLDEPASIRRISRNTGISHRVLSRKLRDLENAGLVEVAYERENIRLYRATDLCRVLQAVATGGC